MGVVTAVGESTVSAKPKFDAGSYARVTAVETKNTQQDTAIAKAQSTADGAVTKNTEQDTAISKAQSTADGAVTKNTQQDENISALQTMLGETQKNLNNTNYKVEQKADRDDFEFYNKRIGAVGDTYEIRVAKIPVRWVDTPGASSGAFHELGISMLRIAVPANSTNVGPYDTGLANIYSCAISWDKVNKDNIDNISAHYSTSSGEIRFSNGDSTKLVISAICIGLIR